MMAAMQSGPLVDSEPNWQVRCQATEQPVLRNGPQSCPATLPRARLRETHALRLAVDEALLRTCPRHEVCFWNFSKKTDTASVTWMSVIFPGFVGRGRQTSLPDPPSQVVGSSRDGLPDLCKLFHDEDFAHSGRSFSKSRQRRDGSPCRTVVRRPEELQHATTGYVAGGLEGRGRAGAKRGRGRGGHDARR